MLDNKFNDHLDDFLAQTHRASHSWLFRWPLAVIHLVLLLIILSACLPAKGNSEPDAAELLTATAVPTLASFFKTPQLDQSITPTGQTTAVPETVQATVPSGPQILLLNPESGLVFTSDETIHFDWSYPVPLTSDQQFLLQITTKTGTQILGEVTNPITSSKYQLEVNLTDWDSISGLHQWFVVLETISDNKEIVRSALQSIMVQTVVLVTTPTSIPTLTPTLTITPTPEATAVPHTPTLSAVCTPAPPSSWVVYTVQENDYLFNLALATGSTVERIQEVNCLTTVGLGIGQRLWLPILPPTATPTLAPASAPTTKPSDSGPGSDAPQPTKTPPPLP